MVDRDAKLSEERRDLGVSDEIAAIEGVSAGMAVLLGKADIKSLDDLADLASDELREIVGENGLSLDEANIIIMAARAHWFDAAGGEGNKDQFNGDKPGDGSSGNVGDGELATDRTVAALDEENANDAESSVSETEANEAKGVVD